MTSEDVLPRSSGSTDCAPNHTTWLFTLQVSPTAACRHPPQLGPGQMVSGIAEAASVAETVARSGTRARLRRTVRAAAATQKQHDHRRRRPEPVRGGPGGVRDAERVDQPARRRDGGQQRGTTWSGL